jgi:opacity protein-like surface antigen
MKLTALLALTLSLPAFAGSPSKQSLQPLTSEPALWNWFAGGSVGYLVDAEEEAYHLHLGVDTPWTVGGFNVAIFGEVGYTEEAGSETYFYGEDYYSDLDIERVNYSLEIVPLTLNVKLERSIGQNLNFYVGAGAGVAFVDFSARGFGESVSDDDTVFMFQAFAGVSYDIHPSFQVYGGARWIYLDDSEFFGIDVDSGDDVLLEAGLRFKF